MKKPLLYSVMGLALVLCLALSMAGPVMGQGGIDVSKYEVWNVTSGHPAGFYTVNQTVYYCINVTNLNAEPMLVTKAWDTIPVDFFTGDPIPETITKWWDDSIKDWVDTDPLLEFSIPGGQSWIVTFNHTIREEDVDWHPVAEYYATMNRFCGNSTQGAFGCDTATVRVIQPAIHLEKTVTPDEAQAGQNVTYTFNITNTGDWPLKDMTLIDDVCGNLTVAGNLIGLVLNSTDSHSFTHNYTIQSGDLPLVNTATVSGTAQDFDRAIAGAVVYDTDTAEVTSEAPSVGGTAYPVNTLSILAPWIALGAVITAGAAILVRRRRQARI